MGMESAGVRTPVIAADIIQPRSSIVMIACFLPAVGKCRWLSTIRFGLRSSLSRFELWPSRRRESPYSSREADGRSWMICPCRENAEHTETIVTTEIGLLHGAAG